MKTITLTHFQAVYLNELIERALDNDDFVAYMTGNIGDFGMRHVHEAKAELDAALNGEKLTVD